MFLHFTRCSTNDTSLGIRTCTHATFSKVVLSSGVKCRITTLGD